MDPDRRLPGEEESEQSLLLEDALHWQQVYSELIGIRQNLIATGHQNRRVPVVAEVAGDRTTADAVLARLTRRQQYWQDRVKSLAGR